MFVLSWKCSQQCNNVSHLSSVNRRGYVFNLILSSMLVYCLLWNLKSQSLSWVLEITTSLLLFEFIWCCSCSAFSEHCVSWPGASFLRTSPSSFNCLLFCFSFLLSLIFGELLFNIIFFILETFIPEYNIKFKDIHAHFPLSFPQMPLQMGGPFQLFLFYTLWYRCN